jgi:hypothetical protein
VTLVASNADGNLKQCTRTSSINTLDDTDVSDGGVSVLLAEIVNGTRVPLSRLVDVQTDVNGLLG